MLAHLTKILLFTGVSQLIILAVAAIGITSTVWDDPLLWAMLPIYASLYAYDWWDALIAASASTPEIKLEANIQLESNSLPRETQSQPEINSED